VDVPVIVGGGLNTIAKASNALAAGADMIVVGNAIESNPGFLLEISQLIASYNLSEV
jgi:putative glycerol-1-phosphate prenyltransferase